MYMDYLSKIAVLTAGINSRPTCIFIFSATHVLY